MGVLLFLCLHFTTANVDYITLDQNITFDSGDSNNTFSVRIVNDTIPESDETFEVFLKPLPGDDVVIGEPSVAVGTIFDDEVPSKAFYNYEILFSNIIFLKATALVSYICINVRVRY